MLRTNLPQFPEKAWEETSEAHSEVIEESFYGQNMDKYQYSDSSKEKYMRGIQQWAEAVVRCQECA